MIVHKPFFRPLRIAHDYIMQYIRSSKLSVLWLTGFWINNSDCEQLWDYTTPLLMKALDRYSRDGIRIWDLGCGPIAILSLFVTRRCSAEIVASDWEQGCVVRAKKIIQLLELDVKVYKSDLGANIDGDFDLVSFNAPYLPSKDTSMLPTSRPIYGERASTYMKRFSGGDDGTSTITRLLKNISPLLRPDARILLGINRVYISVDKVESLSQSLGFITTDYVTLYGYPSCVLVLQQRK